MLYDFITKSNRYGPGPGVTEIIDLRDRSGKGVEHSYVLEDGTAPSAVEFPFKIILKWIEAANSGVDTTPGEDDWKELGRHITGRAFNNTATLLAMSVDTSRGVIKLDELNGRVWIDYPGVGKGENFDMVHEGLVFVI